MKTVAVLLSAYNGTRYIEEQIDSVLAQEEVDVTIFVRDDGSKDGTVDFLNTRYKDDPRVVVKPEPNCGVGISFMRLLYGAPDTFDYYCFCDQDDIWLPRKIITAINMIEEKSGPVLYASNQLLVDSNGEQYDIRYHSEPAHGYRNIICTNKLAGCTFVWNNALQKIVAEKRYRPDESFFKIRIHDVWVILIAAITGTVIYDPDSYIKYRIHSANEVGTVERKNLIQKFKADYTTLFVKKKTRHRSDTCKLVVELFSDLLSPEDLQATKEHYEYLTDGKIKRKLLVSNNPYFRGEKESLLKYKIKILFNIW